MTTSSESPPAATHDKRNAKKKRKRNSWPRSVAAGTGTLAYVGEMRSMRICKGTHLLSSRSARARLAADGYILVRNALPRNLVESARAAVLARLEATGFLAHASDPAHLDMVSAPIPSHMQTHASDLPDNSICSIRTFESPGLLSQQDWIANEDALMAVFEHPRLCWLASTLLSENNEQQDNPEDACNAATLPFKWLRAVGTGLFTGLHCDRVFVGHMHDRLITMWIPLGHITPEQGALIVASGSHRNNAWHSVREEYGRSRVGRDGTKSGWLCLDPNDAKKMLDRPSAASQHSKYFDVSIDWRSAEFEPGDVCVLSLDLMHMSATNTTNDWRISCDTRWLPLPSQPPN